MKNIRGTAALLAVALLSGCAHRGQLYDWGGYDNLLYQQYKDPTKTAEMRSRLEAHVAQLEKSEQKVPPGMYAEMGTLYLQADDRPKAIDFYQREEAAWPESRQLMQSMIETLKRRDAAGPKDAP